MRFDLIADVLVWTSALDMVQLAGTSRLVKHEINREFEKTKRQDDEFETQLRVLLVTRYGSYHAPACHWDGHLHGELCEYGEEQEPITICNGYRWVADIHPGVCETYQQIREHFRDNCRLYCVHEHPSTDTHMRSAIAKRLFAQNQM